MDSLAFLYMQFYEPDEDSNLFYFIFCGWMDYNGGLDNAGCKYN